LFMAGFCSNKKCSKKKTITAVLAIVAGIVALWLVWFGTGNLISKELVESNLKDFSDELSEVADAHGKTAKLSYGEIEITGFGYAKKAIIHNPSVDVAIKGVESGRAWSLSTDSLSVDADPMNSSHIMVTAANPILISEDGKPSQTISFSEPFMLGYGKLEDSSGANILQHDVFLPKQITISHENATAEQAKGQTLITFSSVPSFKIISIPEQKKKLVNYDFTGVEVSTDEGSKTAIGHIYGEFNQQYNDGDKFSVTYNLALSDVVASDSAHSSKPYSFNLDVAVDGEPALPKPVVAAESPADASAQAVAPVAPTSAVPVVPYVNKKVSIKQFAFSGADFKVGASGDIAVDSEDPLPTGLVTLQIDNLQNFLSSEVVPSGSRGVLEAVLERMIGQPVAKQENVSIPLKREKNGSFYLGQTTFEAIASNFLTDILMSHPSSEPAASGEPQISAPSIAMPVETAPVQLEQKTDAVAPAVSAPAPAVGGAK
jgi:hypothetical protein